ncbi:MAG TPA: TolC family protein, partial [Polyangiaceae bacterium LLY-WYZ-15_(1-7)]|nr:TolC family protein [Polyangiaceae bacterium LLY-WYZ-15_(1-7)]
VALADALDAVAIAAEKIALDVALMAQTEIGELSEPAATGAGGSSSMPHKRNPVGCTRMRTAARQVHANVALMHDVAAQPLERGLGEWQAEWAPLIDSLQLVEGMLDTLVVMFEGLDVRVDAMQHNLRLAASAFLAEPATDMLMPHLAAAAATRLVAEAIHQAVAQKSELADVLLERPEVAAHERLAEAAEAEIEGLRARRFPNVALGLDWIETGPARGGDPARSGDDPLILGVSVGLPVDLGADRALARAARAEGDAHRADAEAARRDAAAEVARALAEVRDARRRAALHEETLRPQAEAAFEATLGAYQAGRVGVAALMMALREQLEVELGLERARADFAVAWARLEAAVGRPVEARGDGDAPERDVVENGQGQGHGHGQGSEGGAR